MSAIDKPIDRWNARFLDVAKVDKATAIERGFKHYWPNEKCDKGHNSHRYVSNNTCVICQYQSNKLFLHKKIHPDSTSVSEKRRKAEAVMERLEEEKDWLDYLEE